MTTFLLIRHATNDSVGHSIAGRRPGVRLNAHGRRQAEALAERLGGLPIAAVYASPLERAVETAEPLAARLGLQVRLAEGVMELDYGEWTGLALAELEGRPGWSGWNTFRSGTRIPGGEHLLEVQARAVTELDRLAAAHRDALVAVVSHGDVIRAVLGHYLGIPIDLLLRLAVEPASVSILRLEAWGPQIQRLNDTGAVTLDD